MTEYHHLVDTQGNRGRLYAGPDAADAMAAWSAAITAGAEYVTLESLRKVPVSTACLARNCHGSEDGSPCPEFVPDPTTSDRRNICARTGCRHPKPLHKIRAADDIGANEQETGP